MRKNKKNSTSKKLVSAAAMLALSTAMLGSSTYAWFTMSREVEVKNIKLTATVPEDLQISLGALAIDTNNATAVTEANKAMSLANSSGVLLNGTASDPGNASWNWSSSADISAYYQFGKLMPASSTDGATIYYTPDATGVGRTVNSVPKYYAANSALDPFKTGGTAAASGTDDVASTTAHAVVARTAAGAEGINDTWMNNTYEKATSWDDTNDDGYYVDIPVWLRSSATEDINISVAGYVLPGSTDTTAGKTQTELELYRSVRVAILNGDAYGIKATKTATASTVTEGSVVNTNNILPLADAWNVGLDGSTAVVAADQATHAYKAINGISDPYTGSSILDSGIYIERTTETTGLWGVNALTAYTAEEVAADLTGHITTSDKYPTYATYTAYNGEAIATIKANTTSDSYGEAKKLIIRVWLDGEDEECWNDNAGQDWAISLRFTKVDIPAGA